MDLAKPNLPHDWEIIDDAIVAITAPGQLETPTWSRFIDALKDPHTKKVFNFVRGEVTIDAIKRKQAADAVSAGKLEVTVVTDSRITRGVLTAVSWLGGNIKAYSWADVNKAIDRVGPSPVGRQRMQEIATAFNAIKID